MRPSLKRGHILAISAVWLLIAVAFWRSLFFYFLSDDFLLLQHAAAPHTSLRQWFTTGGGDGFFRPVGYLSLAWTSRWAGADPCLWHAAALLLHAVNAALVYVLALVSGRSRAAAAIASALFAVHGTRPEAAVWIAGRFDLLAAFFVLCGLLLFRRSQTAASLVCTTLAMLTKESAYVFPVFLLLSPDARERGFWKRWIPFAAVAVAVFAYRWTLFHGIGGYRDAHTGQAQLFTMGAVKALEAMALRVWAALWFPLNWSREPDKMVAVLTAVYLLAVVRLATAITDRAELLRAGGFVLISILPPLPLLLIGPDLAKSRLLYLPSVGFCLLLSLALDGLRDRLRPLIAGAVLAFHLAALQHNLDAWEYAAGKARAAAAAAAKCASPDALPAGLPGSLRGVPFFANGFPEAIAFEARTAARPPQLSCTAVWDPAIDELRITDLP